MRGVNRKLPCHSGKSFTLPAWCLLKDACWRGGDLVAKYITIEAFPSEADSLMNSAFTYDLSAHKMAVSLDEEAWNSICRN